MKDDGMAETPDYKSTIRLPQTDFPMKGDLPLKEPTIVKNWDEKNIYRKMVSKNNGKKKFILPDGPPYANGSIHLGHALNKTLKDIIIKYKNMQGFQAVFIPGWDCHGLPIEHKVLKDLQAKKQTKNDQEILALCREEAQKWVGIQREDFRRLGILADWDHPYLTMQPSYEAEEVREFARSFKKGLVYRGVKPVYWNWVLKTALADAEVEYHNHKSPSIYVKFPITDSETLSKIGKPRENTSIVIWTTTPWTLPANTGIALHPDFEYAVYNTGTENLVIAKGLKEAVEKDTGLTLSEGFSFKGSEIENCKAHHPWINRDSIIVLGPHVSLDAGTGAVHTAPGHGADDFKVGLKYRLPVINPVDDAGLFTEEVPEFKGLNIFKANPLIVEKLSQSGHLLAHKEIEHSYPHCWRSKAPLIFRTTPQWFIGLDLEGSHIRTQTVKAIDGIKFVPQWGEARFRAMMENRPDWCVSRQRLWGVPIPVFTCNATSEVLADHDVMMKVADVIEAEGGISAFSANDPAKFISNEAIEKARKELGNPAFGTQGFRHGRDILDVWFDSGVCHAAVQKKREGMGFPADLYLEGSDQHRGWFNTSLLSSMCTNGETPFKALLTHGFTLDSQGRKMSKSLGNSIEPQEVSSKSGAEIIRLWTSYGDYGKDMSCGKSELDRVTETYRRIRNSMRYLLGATSDFDATKDSVPYEKLTWVDKWALARLANLHKEVTEAYDNYEFYKIYHALNIFFTVDLSATYMDVLKDRLYTWKHDGMARRGSQTVLYYMAENLTRMMAPILSFLAEESYAYLKAPKKLESVFLLDYPEIPPQWFNAELSSQFEDYLKVRSDVQKVLEGLRTEKIIGSSLEAKVIIFAEGELLKKLKNYSDLREFLIVSEVEIKESKYRIEATKASGQKCVRCWVYSNETGLNPKHPEVCPKCIEALS
jgi:isoleucyl-tRNA synthetase